MQDRSFTERDRHVVHVHDGSGQVQPFAFLSAPRLARMSVR
jgi:hypothetical protein